MISGAKGFVFIYLIFFGSIQVYSQNKFEEFLSPLGQPTPDSISESKSYFPSGIVKDRTTTIHSHYYLFNIKRDKYLRTTFVKVKEYFNENGILTKKDSLAPRETGFFFEKYFNQNGANERVTVYESKIVYDQLDPKTHSSLPSDFQKVREYLVTADGKRIPTFPESDPPKFLVNQDYKYFNLSSKYYRKIFDSGPLVKYATFTSKKGYLEVCVRNPANDSLLRMVRVPYTGSIINSNDPDTVRKFLVKHAKILIEAPLVEIYDSKTKTRSIVDSNFELIVKGPLKDYRVLSPPQGGKYLWICKEKCGLYAMNGKNIIRPIHDIVYPDGNFLKVQTGREYACMNYQGKVVIPYSKEYGAFDLSENDIACIWVSEFSPNKSGMIYVNLITRDTLKFESGIPFKGDFAIARKDRMQGVINSSGRWVVNPSKSINEIQLTHDGFALITVKNPKFYDIQGDDRLYWIQKYILKSPDSIKGKTNLLMRHPDFDPMEYKHVLMNLVTKQFDTLKTNSTVLKQSTSYSLSVESDRFVNGFVKVLVYPADGGLGKSFYSLLAVNGKVVDVEQKYRSIESDMDEHGRAIVKIKRPVETKNGLRDIEFYGVVTSSGKELIPSKFYACTRNKYGYQVFAGDGKYGLMNFDGEFLLEPTLTFKKVEQAIRKAEHPFIEIIVISY